MTEREILEKLKIIMHRDLKLQPDRAIPDDMPLVGSDMDLDSLDILLLVSSVEKELKIKIPTQAVGQSAFQSLSTLAAFVHGQLQGAAAGAGVGTAAGAPAPVDYLQLIPHAEPFRFVSRVTQVRPGEAAEGVWQLTGQEAFFKGHFPGQPIVPGVLITEALAQIAGLAVPVNGTPRPASAGKLAHVDVRFEEPVAPPAEITLKSRLQRSVGELHQFEVTAVVRGSVVARGSVTLHRPKEA